MNVGNGPFLHGEIESPRPLRAPQGMFTLVGWCLVQGNPIPPDVRLVTDSATLPMITRHERSDVSQLLPLEPAAALCGFTIEGMLPAGVHWGRLGVQLPDKTWIVFKQFTIAAESIPFRAALDEPISDGILRDRVKVGGWSLDAGSPVVSLTLRYGHRSIPCEINRPRRDVATAFPHIPHAGHSGFESEDFLVAGHGPVRVQASLADGRIVVTPTLVSFSIAADENHGTEIDLTAPRIGLNPGHPARTPPQAIERTARSLNILFVLPGSFSSNHALHVASLANELAAQGHQCAVAVAHDPDTLSQLDHPTFRGLTHTEALNDPIFANQTGPDIVHAWTTRENVRRLSEQLRSRHACRVIVHLEDNEQQILALTLERPFAELAKLGDGELARLMPGDLSHPRLSSEFLAHSDGVTLIMDRLREFSPNGKPHLTIMPAADERHYYARPLPVAFRDTLQLAPATTVLFYHGNVHASNANEMRELYAAVLQLNQAGESVLLIRTGLDRVEFLGDIAKQVAPHVLSLGQIHHHHHLPALMSLADIFVQPGTPDAFNNYRFPSKLPEFFALGRPVVLPRTNLGTVTRHGIDAYVLDRADCAGIVRAVRHLRADKELYQSLGRGALEFARTHFSWRRSAGALAKFYLALAGS